MVPDASSAFDAIAQSVALFRAHCRPLELRRDSDLWVCTHEKGIWRGTVASVIQWAEARRGEQLPDRLLTELRDVR
jgi:hypothetical protein